jgi:hypothetical protein
MLTKRFMVLLAISIAALISIGSISAIAAPNRSARSAAQPDQSTKPIDQSRFIIHQPSTVVTTAHPIMFVTQFPIPADFTAIGSVFGNHRADIDITGRGGDLWIRYGDGTLKNLTAAAGYGNSGFQGANAIAVRDPAISWDGTKAIFSMVIGAPTARYQVATYHWQLYEVTGFLNPAGTVTITKVPNQPANYNNISPIYGSDGRIIFTTDRPRLDQPQLYPQLDEYEEAPTVSGLWSLNPATGDLIMLDHAPSGDFTPIIDSFGRVIFTRWDHLQRDQQADSDYDAGSGFAVTSCAAYCTFNYSSEEANAAKLATRAEIFPEPRSSRTDLLSGTHVIGHSFNVFFPWMIDQDGTQAETLNHIGRHEFSGYLEPVFDDDDNLEYFYNPALRLNQNSINNFLQIREDPLHPGVFYGVDAPEFYTHAGGQIISTTAKPTTNPDLMTISYVTDRETASFTDVYTTNPKYSGHYRNPLPTSDGKLIAAHTWEQISAQNTGSITQPLSNYDFRLKTLKNVGGYWQPEFTLTLGITKSISYWDPDYLVTYNGPLWELSPVEVVARSIPGPAANPVPAIEQNVFISAGVTITDFQNYLRQNDLALIVSRNVTRRDDADLQQPFNLRVVGGVVTTKTLGKIYDIKYMQFFQGDQVRGLGGTIDPRDGRRVLAQLMHGPLEPPNPSGPASSVILGADGSMAAFVPARRALSWQLTAPDGTPVVHERYWLTFQPGEIRVCTNCHGINALDQVGQPAPTNAPQALQSLLEYWQTLQALNNKVFLPVIMK